MLTMLALCIPNMRDVRKVGHPGPTLSTHQRVITSTIFKETDGRILILFCVWKANMSVKTWYNDLSGLRIFAVL